MAEVHWSGGRVPPFEELQSDSITQPVLGIARKIVQLTKSTSHSNPRRNTYVTPKGRVDKLPVWHLQLHNLCSSWMVLSKQLNMVSKSSRAR